MAEENTPTFQIQRIYLKESSLEQPNSPAILLEQMLFLIGSKSGRRAWWNCQ